MILAKLGLRNFWLQRRRNLFALSAIAVGATGLICLGGYIDRWEHTLRAESIYIRGQGMLSVYKKNGWLMSRSLPEKYSLSRTDQEQIISALSTISGIEKLGPILLSNGLVSNGCRSFPFEIRGYDLAVDGWMREKAEVTRWCGRLLAFRRGKSFLDSPSGPMIGMASGLASLIGKEAVTSEGLTVPPVTYLTEYCANANSDVLIAQDPNVQLMALSFDGHFNAADADLAHIFNTGTKVSEDTQMTAPLNLVQDLFQTHRVSTIAVYLKDFRDTSKKALELRQHFLRAGLSYDVHEWDERKVSPFYTGVMNFLRAMSVFCTLLIGSVVVLAVVNLTMMNVLQRSREMGTLKALGFGRAALSKIFFFEALALGASGCLLGGCMSKGIAELINRAGITFTPPGFSMPLDFLLVPDPLTFVVILMFVFFLVIVSASVTAWILARRSCLELLTQNA